MKFQGGREGESSSFSSQGLRSGASLSVDAVVDSDDG